MKKEMTGMKGTLDEHTQLLKALEHKTDVISANVVKTQEDVNVLMGKYEGMEKEIGKIKDYVDYQTYKIAENEPRIVDRWTI